VAVDRLDYSQVFFLQGADRIQQKSGVGIPEMNKKNEPSTGYYIYLRFLNGQSESFKIH
jgi:hypothetical protein